MVNKPANERVVAALTEVGVRSVMVAASRAVELKLGPPITHDDLLSFHLALADGNWQRRARPGYGEPGDGEGGDVNSLWLVPLALGAAGAVAVAAVTRQARSRTSKGCSEHAAAAIRCRDVARRHASAPR